MNDRAEPVVPTDASADEYIPPPFRLYEIVYIDGTTERFSSQHVNSGDGRLIFIDEEYAGPGQVRLWYRQTIAAGQWRKYVEVTLTPGSQVN